VPAFELIIEVKKFKCVEDVVIQRYASLNDGDTF